LSASPASAIAAAQHATAAVRATPWRPIFPIHPLHRPARIDPIAIEEYSKPTPPWKRVAAACGNSACGIASAIAAMSRRNETSTTGFPPMNRSPSPRARSPLRPIAARAGMAGSRNVDHSAAVNSSASMPYAQA
jgi:hypothetical protein